MSIQEVRQNAIGKTYKGPHGTKEITCEGDFDAVVALARPAALSNPNTQLDRVDECAAAHVEMHLVVD